MEERMEKITYCWLLTVCLLIAFIFLLKFIKVVWIKRIEMKESDRLEAKRNAGQDKINNTKNAVILEQEGIRKLERVHELALQENKKTLMALEITLKEKEIELKGK
jgi:biopolymer transport protein ExbB/TolQ